ncbi:MAG: dTDP-4-dehydrorhamnose reductase [Candidatus Pristimantibacillus lignocellulolyticus]|uniref:dTDP-4-dehydrorhamnose reductase n=1 Tax=Candidatus Pristimantibacillus lignocellulolyticus TaxID=2994561 RepID=A0A9J6ZGZ5_9BACL|nr:MAG: dTDP-4-dehydrorhamnose reductase [Candidatus Pristimantibacillus lignocellulolyticus]
MRVVVTGAGGQLGFDILKQLRTHNIECYGLDRNHTDITDFKATKQIIEKYMPTIVIHCAAYTNVDNAEKNIEECKLVNTSATANIADVCKSIDAKLMYISTDYVFSGNEPLPYEVDSKTMPLSVYGHSKLEGELEVIKRLDKYFVVRTSWSFGTNGSNFVQTMLRIGTVRDSVNVVSDQFGSPTFTRDLAELIISMIQTDKYGIYHATNEGFCSWAEFAEEIYLQAGYSTKVNFIKSDDYITLATRPKNSMLSKRSLDAVGFNRLPEWKDALKRYLIHKS